MSNQEEIRTHLSDETLIRLLSDELGGKAWHRANKHLATCWECRLRRERLEQVTRKIVSYGKYLAASDANEPTENDPFITQLKRAFSQENVRPRWVRLLAHIGLTIPGAINPVTASVALFAVIATLFLIRQGNIQIVTASELMNGAVAEEKQKPSDKRLEVASQTIRIRTRDTTFERTVYRDLTGSRQPHKTNWDKERALLEPKLASAGVLWDEPLSADSFRTWHDEHNGAVDRISRDRDGYLTLTTKVSDGIVREESFTVREHTFHPVERKVEFVDMGSVDFLELNYDVLAWNSINSDVFEPLPGPAALRRGAHISSALPAPPAIPLTVAQLDEAELRARLALNQMHADTSERIEIHRGPEAVRVEGIVPTEERKQEIRRSLSTIPHVASAIRSFRELEIPSSAGLASPSVRQGVPIGQRSALEDYLLPAGFSPDEVREIGHELFNNSAVISQEGTALSDIERRFSSKTMTGPGRDALNKLRRAHIERLLAALDTENNLLHRMRFPVEAIPDGDSPGFDLKDATELHANLCAELLTNDHAPAKYPAERTVAELARSVTQLRAIVLRVRDHSIVSNTSLDIQSTSSLQSCPNLKGSACQSPRK